MSRGNEVNQIFQYQIAGTGLDVENLRNQLVRMGIPNVMVERGPNANSISIILQNPTPQQVQAVREVFSPVEQNFRNVFYQLLQSITQPQLPPAMIQQSASPLNQQYPGLPASPMGTPPGFISPGVPQNLPLSSYSQVQPPQSNIRFTLPGFASNE